MPRALLFARLQGGPGKLAAVIASQHGRTASAAFEYTVPVFG